MDFPRGTPELEKLLARIEAKSTPVTESGCWLWTERVNLDGYGVVTYRGGSIGAHRASHMVYIGPIPEGQEVCHKCDTPPCVNPAHLFAASHGHNMRDCFAKGRRRNDGKFNPRAKLSPLQVEDIRTSTDKVRTQASRYGVSQATISMIRTGRNWRQE